MPSHTRCPPSPILSSLVRTCTVWILCVDACALSSAKCACVYVPAALKSLLATFGYFARYRATPTNLYYAAYGRNPRITAASRLFSEACPNHSYTAWSTATELRFICTHQVNVQVPAATIIIIASNCSSCTHDPTYISMQLRRVAKTAGGHYCLPIRGVDFWMDKKRWTHDPLPRGGQDGAAGR